ncbi:MAG: LigA, partial [bacterium]|nr:LigA [bacterium]
KRCDATGGCVCPGGQLHESSCGDGQDNDCDGLVDCADPDCNAIVCSAVGGKLCNAGACACPYGNAPETTCNDGIDNDCNGVADCNDPACNGKQCGPSGTQLCFGTTPAATCKDTTSQYALVLTAQRTAIPADGASTLVVTAKLSKDTTGNGTFAVQTNQPLTFASSDAQAPLTSTAVTTDSNGTASTTLLSDAAGGTANVTASYTIPGSSTVITAALAVTMPALGSVKQTNQQYSVMGARYSGFQETNLITFQLLDSASNPYPAGLAVTFTHASLGGSYLGNAATPCAVGPSNCMAASGVTDGNGQVQVLLHAGTVANIVSVSAGASAGGVSASGTASNIAIVGARASGAHISVDCTPKNIPALTTQDCTSSQYFGKTITCTASLADRFNNVLGVGTLTTFNSEAGAAGPPAMTPSYDPAIPPTGQLGLGHATDFVSVGGYALPVDVAAFPATTPPSPKTSFPAEYSLTYVDACGNRTHNPRDGLSTIIASAVGEEGFVDGSNGCPADGVYQGPSAGGCGGGKGENFIDSGEPFVDANDNGARDADEAYVDANNNGKHDPPNGVWDTNTVIWAQTRVLYSGAAAVGQVGGQEAFSRFYTSTIGEPQSPAPTPPASFALPVNGAGAYGIYFVDGNFNPPAPPTLSKYDAAKTSGTVLVTLAQSPTVPDNVAMGFSQQYCARPNSSSFDPGNSRATVSSVAGGAATLDGLSGLVAADVGNYLTLSGATNAGNDGVFQIVAVSSATSVTIANAQAVAGDSVDWIDSQSDLTGCASTCQHAPCYIVPHVASFHYGAVGTVSIGAPAMPEAGESVQASCTTVGSATTISITGQTN